jgi:hypothetical protein
MLTREKRRRRRRKDRKQESRNLPFNLQGSDQHEVVTYNILYKIQKHKSKVQDTTGLEHSTTTTQRSTSFRALHLTLRVLQITCFRVFKEFDEKKLRRVSEDEHWIFEEERVE